MTQHLTSVPQPAEPARAPRTFPELVTAIYEDPRVGHATRELLLAVGYGLYLAERPNGENPLTIARRKLGVTGVAGQARYDELVAADATSRRSAQWTRSPRSRPARTASRTRTLSWRTS
jgi:hypothetical protein